MSPPPHEQIALPGRWAPPASSGRRPLAGRRLSARAWLLAIAVCALAFALVVGGYASLGRAPAPARPSAMPGTAFLGTATCARWANAGEARRATIIGTLGVAATQPDPENPGATLSPAAAYGLFERACSTPASRSALLYEIYNRSASFQGARASFG